MVGPVLDASGVAVTDCVVADFEGSVNGGDPAALNGSATLTHRGVGFYSLALTATDLGTVGSFEVTINDTVNACPMKEVTVIEEAVYDGMFAASAAGYLQPTTAGRTLDVTATGAAGIDWGNVENPTTSVALTGTTIATTQKVDVETIKTNPVANGGTVTFPTNATLASTTNITGGSIGLTAAAVQAIWDAATSALTTAGSIGKYLLDHIVGTLASGTHNPQSGDAYAYLGTNMGALGANLTAADDAVMTRLGAPAGASVSADVAAIQADTDNIQTRLPAALTADGNMKSDTLRVNGTTQTAADLAFAGNFVYLDHNAGSNGTGTEASPHNTMTLALASAASKGIHAIFCKRGGSGTSTITVTGLDLSGYTIYANNTLDCGVGATMTNTTVIDGKVIGVVSGTGLHMDEFEGASIVATTTLPSGFRSHTLWGEAGTLTLAGNAYIDGLFSTSASAITIDFNNVSATLNIKACQGDFTIANMPSGASLSIGMQGGTITFAASVNASAVPKLFGIGAYSNSSSCVPNVAALINPNKIADHVKRRTQANTEASSDGDTLDLSSLYGAIQQGQESAISGTTQTVYKTDGSTSLGTKTIAKAARDPINSIS